MTDCFDARPSRLLSYDCSSRAACAGGGTWSTSQTTLNQQQHAMQKCCVIHRQSGAMNRIGSWLPPACSAKEHWVISTDGAWFWRGAWRGAPRHMPPWQMTVWKTMKMSWVPMALFNQMHCQDSGQAMESMGNTEPGSAVRQGWEACACKLYSLLIK